MYVYEEIINGKKLTEIINETHENVKYLPGQKLPENVVSFLSLDLVPSMQFFFSFSESVNTSSYVNVFKINFKKKTLSFETI